MRIRFWGTRGSIAKPGPTTMRYGGNTACVEVRTGNGELIVLDCGTGAHDLGLNLLSGTTRCGHLLITHTHWDHIQGFPFFAPLFVPGNEWDVHAPAGLGKRLEDTLAGQMEYSYFPITLTAFAAKIRYHELSEGTFALGGVRVTTQFLNHPALTLGYRLEIGGVSVVYASDHEPHSRHVAEGTHESVHHEDRRHVEFLRGADLVIHDAQYTAQEYPNKVGWGHTSMERAVDFALAAGVKRLALYHHDPLRDDAALDGLVENLRRSIAARGGRLDLLAAAEGATIELPESATRTPEPVADDTGPITPAPFDPARTTVLIADDDPITLRLLCSALEPEGYRIVTARDGESALVVARHEKPALCLFDWDMPGKSGLEICRALRAEADPRLREIPVVLITGMSKKEDLESAFAAGIVDFLTKPFSPQQVRTRVQTWLARSRNNADHHVPPS